MISFMRGLVLAGVLAVLSAASFAETLPYDGPVETPAGVLSIVPTSDGFLNYISIGDQTFFERDPVRYLGLIERRGDLVLLFLSHGGSGCGGFFHWLHTSEGDVRLSEEFGTCASEVEVSHDSETVTVTMAALSAEDPMVSFVYDGRVVREVALGQSASFSPPSAGGLPWVGRYAYELFRASDWRPALVAVMGEDGYAFAGETFNLAAPMERQGDWVVGTGCRQHDCGDWRGAVALHVSDGRILVAINNHGDVQVWGKDAGDAPPMIGDVMAGR